MFTLAQKMGRKRLGVFFAVIALLILVVPLVTSAQAQSGGNSLNPLTVIGQYIGNTILGIASWITYFGGKLLGVSIEKLILNLGNLLGSSGSLGSMIGLLWGMIRDLCNLLFIFGFIYIGIRTIFDADDSNAKRMLASLIIGAILINFSLYFTKVVIDISNYTAVEIYHATFVGSGTISDKLGEILGIFDFMKGPNPTYLANTTVDGSFAFYFMAGLLLMVAGFVFASGALLLVTRFIALVFLMIFSPFLFAATVFPQTAGYASQLWRLLFNYSFFAPAYLIMLLISLKFIEAIMGMLNATNSSVPKGMSEGRMDSFDVILAFIIGIMVMIYALKISKQFGIAGSNQVMAIGNNIRGKLQGFAGRNTVGRASNYLLKRYEKEDANASKMTGPRGVVNRFGRGILQYSGADEGIRDTLKAGKAAKFGGKSLDDAKKWDKERDEKRSELNEFDSFKQAVKNGSGPRPTPKQKIEMEQAIAGASVKYLEKLSQTEREKIAKYMTQGQFDNLDKSTELSDTDKRSLGEARQKALKGVYNMERDALMKASVDNLNALGLDFLKREDNAIRLNSSQMDDLKKKLTPTEFGILTTARNEALIKIASGQPIETHDINGILIPGQTKTKAHILSQKPGEISKLPADALKHLAAELPVAALAKIAQDGTLNQQDQVEIRRNIGAALVRNPNDPHINDLEDFFDTPLGKQFG